MNVAVGEMHVVVHDASGTCWSFGHSDYGKLGHVQVQRPALPLTGDMQAAEPIFNGGHGEVARGLPTGMRRMADWRFHRVSPGR